MAYCKEVALALGKMGIDPLLKEKREKEGRSKVDPRVAKFLSENVGIHYKPSDIHGNKVNEEGMSPLDMPGEQPLVDPNAQPTGPGAKNNQQTQPGQQQAQPGKKLQPAKVSLKRPATQMKTLQDITDKMTEVTQNIKLVDLMIQALSENKNTDNSIDSHKTTLQGPIRAVVDSVKELQRLVEQ